MANSPDDYSKPSRSERRQKRAWKRPKKKESALTRGGMKGAEKAVVATTMEVFINPRTEVAL